MTQFSAHPLHFVFSLRKVCGCSYSCVSNSILEIAGLLFGPPVLAQEVQSKALCGILLFFRTFDVVIREAEGKSMKLVRVPPVA